MEDIRDRIASLVAREGSVPFSQVMRIALHDPVAGYYARRAPGAGAPFTSSPAASPIYASCLARALESMWTRLGRPDQFVVREVGPGRGDLAAGALDAVACTRFAAALTWQLVEPHAAMRDIQEARLGSRPVEWLRELDELPPVHNGCIIANEVLDTLPVELVRITADETRRLARVTASTSGLQIVYDGAVPRDVADYVDRYVGLSREERTVEVGLDAVAWMRSVAQSMECGYVLVIDYGDLPPDLYDRRPGGSLLVYHDGGVTDDPLASLGNADITAHVNFGAIMDAAAGEGMETLLLSLQRDVLMACGLRRELDNLARAAADAPPLESLQIHGTRTMAAELVRRSGFGGFHMLLVARAAGMPSILEEVPDVRSMDAWSRKFPVPPC